MTALEAVFILLLFVAAALLALIVLAGLFERRLLDWFDRYTRSRVLPIGRQPGRRK